MVGSPEAALQHGRIVVVGHLASDDREALLAALDGHVVIDLANIAALRQANHSAYQGICW